MHKDEKLRQIANSQRGLDMIHPDLDWTQMVKLAKSLNCEIVTGTRKNGINVTSLNFLDKKEKEESKNTFLNVANVIPFKKE